MHHKKKHIVIVGGGAGGLELIARLCKKFNKNFQISINLVDNKLKHVWKPLLHEVAAGTFNACENEIDYISYSYQMGFSFHLGALKKLNREMKYIVVDRYLDKNGIVLLPERVIHYDVLVFAIGSQINNFNTPGVNKYCLLLDNLYQAELFNKKLMQKVILYVQSKKINKIKIAIVGAGATGIELAAELHYVLSTAKKYSEPSSDDSFEIMLIELADRILPHLPLRTSRSIIKYLKSKGIKVFTKVKIIKIHSNSLETDEHIFIESSLVVWAAGVKANPILAKCDGLEVNRINQLIVTDKLQTSIDKHIFALGDCASCPQIDKKGKIYFVPPRAQAAHQEAKILAKSLYNYMNHKPLLSYHYNDYGSLISLSRGNVVGNLMNRVSKNIYIEGWLARFFYWLLYKKHLLVLKGFKYVLLQIITEFLIRKQRPEIKLH